MFSLFKKRLPDADKHYWISFLKDGKLVYVASKIEGGDTSEQ